MALAHLYDMGIISATVHTMASSSTETMKPLVPHPQHHLQALPEDDRQHQLHSRMVFSQHMQADSMLIA